MKYYTDILRVACCLCHPRTAHLLFVCQTPAEAGEKTKAAPTVHVLVNIAYPHRPLGIHHQHIRQGSTTCGASRSLDVTCAHQHGLKLLLELGRHDANVPFTRAGPSQSSFMQLLGNLELQAQNFLSVLHSASRARGSNTRAAAAATAAAAGPSSAPRAPAGLDMEEEERCSKALADLIVEVARSAQLDFLTAADFARAAASCRDLFGW